MNDVTRILTAIEAGDPHPAGKHSFFGLRKNTVN